MWTAYVSLCLARAQLGFTKACACYAPRTGFFICSVFAALKHLLGICVRILQIYGQPVKAYKQHLWEPTLPAILIHAEYGLFSCAYFCLSRRLAEVVADKKACNLYNDISLTYSDGAGTSACSNCKRTDWSGAILSVVWDPQASGVFPRFCSK